MRKVDSSARLRCKGDRASSDMRPLRPRPSRRSWLNIPTTPNPNHRVTETDQDARGGARWRRGGLHGRPERTHLDLSPTSATSADASQASRPPPRYPVPEGLAIDRDRYGPNPM